MENRITVEILGNSITFTGDKDIDYLKRIANYVKEIAKKVEDEGVKIPTKIAIFTALIIADELFELKEKRGNNMDMSYTENKADELIQKIGNLLERNKDILGVYNIK